MRPEVEKPDLYIAFTPGSYGEQLKLEREPGMCMGILKSHPESPGTVLLRSADPEDRPSIRPNYLSAEEERRAVVAGLKIIHKLFQAPALAKYSAFETKPEPQVVTDDELLDFARSVGTPGVHFTTTCRMGSDDRSVVTPELKVRGLEDLLSSMGRSCRGVRRGTRMRRL